MITIKTLPDTQLSCILSSVLPHNKEHLLILGFIADNKLILLTGNLKQIAVPLDIFKPSGTCSPDFDKFELIDYGHTIQFGEYEASSDVVFKSCDHNLECPFCAFPATIDSRGEIYCSNSHESCVFQPRAKNLEEWNSICGLRSSEV